MAINAYNIMNDQHGIKLVRYVNLYDRETYTLYIHAPLTDGLVVEYGIYTDQDLAFDAFNMVMSHCDSPEKQDALCHRLANRHDTHANR